MKPIMFLSIFVFIILSYYIYSSSLTSPISEDYLDAQKLFILVNNYRISQGIKPLDFSSQICPFAKHRLQQLYNEYSDKGFSDIKNYYSYKEAGELISKDILLNRDVLNTWITSPRRRLHLINPSYTHTCVAVDERFAVQEFAKFY